jgi:hypothetical protein
MAPETAVVTADSSNSEILSALTPKQRAEWRHTGALPETPEAPAKKSEAKTEVAESSPAAKEVPEPKVEKPAVEASAEPAPAGKEPKPKGAEARIKELLADNKRLQAEADELRKRPLPAQAKVEEVAKPRRNDVDAKTGQAVFATDEAYEEAVETYLTAKVTANVTKANAKAQQDARIAEQNTIIEKRWQNSLKIATERNPDWATVVEVDKDGKFQHAALKSIKTNGVLDAWILDSEIGADILYHLAKNPDEITHIQSLSPFAAARELTKLEDKLSVAPTPIKDKEPPAESSKPLISKAPSPADNIAGKGTAPTDEVGSAVKGGDFKAYRRAANAEDAQKRKAS